MNSNGIYIGFDGGGSTSRFLIRRGDSTPELHVMALNLKYSDLGIEKSAKGFAECLNEILGAEISLIRAICISLSGASDTAMNKEFEQTLRKELSLSELKLHIESDSSFALETAYPVDGSGMLLIAGTGSVAIGRKRDGEIIKVGGWGRLLGDEGSGYWIGLQALKHYCKVMDGAENGGELFRKIGGRLHEEFPSGLSPFRSKLYHDEVKPQHYTPLVFEAASEDPATEDILFDAAGNLMIGIETLWNKLQGNCEPILTLHGAITRQELISSYIEEQSDALGLKCKMLMEESILERALEVASSLAPDTS